MEKNNYHKIQEMVAEGMSVSKMTLKIKFMLNISERKAMKIAEAFIVLPSLEEKGIIKKEPRFPPISSYTPIPPLPSMDNMSEIEEERIESKKTIRREPFGGVEDADYL